MGKQQKSERKYKYACARCPKGHKTPSAVTRCQPSMKGNDSETVPTKIRRCQREIEMQQIKQQEDGMQSSELVVLPSKEFKPIHKELLHRNFNRSLNSRSYRSANCLIRINRLYAHHPQRKRRMRTSTHFKRILLQRAFYLNQLRFAFTQYWYKQKDPQGTKPFQIFDQYFMEWGASASFGLILPQNRTFKAFLDYLPYSRFMAILQSCRQRLQSGTKIGMLNKLKKWLLARFKDIYLADHLKEIKAPQSYHWNGRTIDQDFQFLYIQAYYDSSKHPSDYIEAFPGSMSKYLPFIRDILLPAICNWREFMLHRQQVLARCTAQHSPSQNVKVIPFIPQNQEVRKPISAFKSSSYQIHRFVTWKQMNMAPPPVKDPTIPFKRLGYLVQKYEARLISNGFEKIKKRAVKKNLIIQGPGSGVKNNTMRLQEPRNRILAGKKEARQLLNPKPIMRRE